jgi:hypothetical protein
MRDEKYRQQIRENEYVSWAIYLQMRPYCIYFFSFRICPTLHFDKQNQDKGHLLLDTQNTVNWGYLGLLCNLGHIILPTKEMHNQVFMIFLTGVPKYLRCLKCPFMLVQNHLSPGISHFQCWTPRIRTQVERSLHESRTQGTDL